MIRCCSLAMHLRGFLYTAFILHLVFLCLLQPLASAVSDGKRCNTAELFKRVSQNVKVNRYKSYNKALIDLNAVIVTDPTLSEAYYHHASVLRQLCSYEESEKSYRKFLELKPRDSVAQKEHSQLYQAKSALDTALTLYESSDFEKSLEYIKKVFFISPACSKAKLLTVKLIQASKSYPNYYLADHNVTQRHYRKGLRVDPEHGVLKKACFGSKNLLETKTAGDNVNMGRLRFAVEGFKAALAMNPNHLAHNAHLHLQLCKLLVKLGRGNDALISFTEALNIDAELLEALVQRGEAKLLTEDWEGAVNDLKSAAQKSPQDMNIRETYMRAEKALKMSKRKDWYSILKVSKTWRMFEIKRAYDNLSLQWRRDKLYMHENREEAEEKLREIYAAYQVLGDEKRRTKYDRGEDIKEMGMNGGRSGFNFFHADGGFGRGFPGVFDFQL